MHSDRSDSTQPSRKIAQELRRAIERGELAPGAKLPSERQLAGHHGTARNTAREAVRLLAEQGLVVARHGKGVFVRDTAPLMRFGTDRYAFRNRRTGLTPFRLEAQRQGKTARIDVLAITREVAPEDIAERLRVPTEQLSVVRRENLYFADDLPVQVVNTFLRWQDAEGTPLMQADSGRDGIYGRLEELGHVMTRGSDDVVARMPTHRERELLELPPGVPVLEVVHTSFNQDDVPFEVTKYVHRADLAGLRYDFQVDQDSGEEEVARED